MSSNTRLVVVLRVTEACNLSCAFCAYDRRLERPRGAADPERVLLLARQLARRGREEGREVLLSLLGGEPLLWPALPALEPELAALGLSLSVTTNGTTLSTARARTRLTRHYAEVTLSIDGFADVHDQVRGWPGGFAALQHSIRALVAEKRATGRGPILRVNTVLMADNIATFPAFCQALAELGIEEITFNQLGGRDRPEFYPAHRLSARHVAKLRDELPELTRTLRAQGVLLRGGEMYLERLAATAEGRPLSVAACALSERFLFVNEAMLAAPCSFSLNEYGVPVARGGPETRLPVVQAREPRAVACHDCPSTQTFAKFAEPA